MILKRKKKDEGKEIRLTSFKLHDLFIQLSMDDARFIARATPEITIETQKGDYKIDVAKLAEEPFIRAQQGLEKQGVSKEEAQKIKDELMAQHETEALEYLRKRPELKEAIDNFVLKVREVDQVKRSMSYYWQILSCLTEAIRCYTGKDNPTYWEAALSTWFNREIEKLKPHWPNISQEIKDEMVYLLTKGYNFKGNEKIIYEVLDYLK